MNTDRINVNNSTIPYNIIPYDAIDGKKNIAQLVVESYTTLKSHFKGSILNVRL